MAHVLVTVPRARPARLLVASLALSALLAGCGEKPNPTCQRFTPSAGAGPGDPEGFFPLSPGNMWNRVVTEAGYPSWTTTTATGPRTILGREAVALATSELDTGLKLQESYKARDSWGVLDLGDDRPPNSANPTDPVPAALLPYYLARFPLSAGDQFVAVSCTDLDCGYDLDGDRKHERLDVQVSVTVVAFEPVEARVGSFARAARIETRTRATLRPTASPQSTVEGLKTEWVAPGVGVVRSATEAVAGAPAVAEELAGYSIGGATRGILARNTVLDDPGSHATAFDGARALLVTEVSPGLGGVQHLQALLVSADGSFTEPAPALEVSGELTGPAVAFGGGVYLVVGTTMDAIHAQRVSTSGQPLDGMTGFVAAAATSIFPCPGPAVASDGTDFLVVWADQGGVRGVRVGADGAVLGETTIALPTEGGGCAQVDFDGNDFLVLYQLSTIHGLLDILARRVDRAGVVLDPVPWTISTAPGGKRLVALLYDGTNHLAAWLDGRDGQPLASLYGARMDRVGTLLDGDAVTGGIRIDAYPNVVLEPWVGFDGESYVAAWVDGRWWASPPGEMGIRVARISKAGIVLDHSGERNGIRVAETSPPWVEAIGSPLPVTTGQGRPVEVVYGFSNNNAWPAPIHELRAVRFAW